MSRYSKFENFFSVGDKTPRMDQTKRLSNGRSNEHKMQGSPSLQLFNRERRSFSIESTLKKIKEKQDLNSRVTDFLTNRKLGLITEEQNKEMKQLKNYNEGNRTKQQTLIFLKQLKKEQDEYTVQTQTLHEQIARAQAKTNKLRERLAQYTNMARFTEETLAAKEIEWNGVSESTAAIVYQNKIYSNVVQRTKDHNVWLRGQITIIRQVAKSKKIRLESLDKNKLIHEKKALLENEAASDYTSFIRQSSVELTTQFLVAQETINSKSELIKALAQNQELKQQAAKEYELKYLSDKHIWKHFRAEQFYKIILNLKHLRFQEANSALQHAFAVVKMRTAIKDPFVFKNSYFQSSETYKELKEKISSLQKQQIALEKSNRQMTETYLRTVLEAQSRQKTVGISFQEQKLLIPHSTYEHIDQAKETMSRIILWASRMQFKVKSLIKRRVQIPQNTFKSELLIKMFLEILREKLLKLD